MNVPVRNFGEGGALTDWPKTLPVRVTVRNCTRFERSDQHTIDESNGGINFRATQPIQKLDARLHEGFSHGRFVLYFPFRGTRIFI
jgi:hypothetical protein